MDIKKGEIIYPGVDDRVALVQAEQTISDVVDAVVELVTNSDDSYSSLEEEGKECSGLIQIQIKRRKGGKLQELIITDNAAGMSSEKIIEVFKYGTKTSEFYRGKNVRGLFGRGLKESILAIGTGEIISCSNGIETHCKYYWDFEEEKLALQLISEAETCKNCGTKIILHAREDKDVKCYDYKTLINKIQDHYALRDILGSSRRKVELIFHKTGLKKDSLPQNRKLKYTPSSGQQIEDRKIYLKGFGVAWFRLFEAIDPLEYASNDPGSRAGILIKTTRAILDNQLFGYGKDPYAHYFFGEIYLPGIAEKLRQNVGGLIRTDRTGLNWKHQFCKELENEIVKVLSHHIDRKRKKDESSRSKPVMPEERAQKIKKLMKKLNKLGKQLLEESGIAPETSNEQDPDISGLTIIPTVANCPVNQYRAFTVYNINKAKNKDLPVEITLDEPQGKFDLSDNRIFLKPHKKNKSLLIGYFKIKGYRLKDKTGLHIKHGLEEDIAEFRIMEMSRKSHAKSALFTDLRFNTHEEKPIQRVFHNRSTGIIEIFVNFPGIYPYIRESTGEGSESPQGSILLAELIAEAFCRETARRKVDKDFKDPVGKIDKYHQFYNEHLKQCIPIIHSIWVS